MFKKIVSLLGFFLLTNPLYLPRALAGVVSARIDGENPSATVSKNNIKVDLYAQKRKGKEGEFVVSKVSVFERENKVLELEGAESFFPMAQVQIAEMDKSNTTPEIIFESYTGGAHCCAELFILTKQNGKWKVIEGGVFDGGPRGVSDVDKNGIYEYVTIDNSFLYTFASYAESVAPPQIWSIQSGKLINATKQPQYGPWLKNELNKLWQQRGRDSKNNNAFWAAYVAWKALLGEEVAAWQLMLKNYNKNENYCLDKGEGYWIYDRCKNKVKFPQALLVFLRENGYLNNESVRRISTIK
ncbi:MAG: hypothetical protein NZ901_06945 [Geminocystis sp.]|nr:hypothetical protein [Geminocystis sp.]HIK36632.1 hypothetical protein [Geminocystis sp. M7585_C2015_104]MCS7147912.1 hypothetical protein [Geminocystis sp.]MCX8078739.1 hypothetical protein [Geminocystis sp.]MDW8116893.1 hypothetical protein [Geminocystis sp.]